MSYHILHINDYGCRLTKERGLLVCEKDGRQMGKIAFEDLRAVVLLNEAQSISGAVMSAITANDAIIIHCKNFKPVGITIPNNRTYDAKVVLNQARGNKNLNSAIWRKLLGAKIENSASCLELIGVKCANIPQISLNGQKNLNEARYAREYWKRYFPMLGEYGMRRNPEDKTSPANIFLNYGYGIMGGLIQRNVIVSGLNYLLGVNHKTYYKNIPLVYDIIEPLRSFVDYALYKYNLSDNTPNIRSWAVYLGKFLSNTRVRKGSRTIKLMDATDALCESLANAYREKKADNLWVPKFHK